MNRTGRERKVRTENVASETQGRQGGMACIWSHITVCPEAWQDLIKNKHVGEEILDSWVPRL